MSFIQKHSHEYENAALFYASRQPGLKIRFIDAVERVIKRILEAPSQCKIIEDEIRQCFTCVFPYAITYSIEDDYILIIAVSHTSREPGYWRNRLMQ